MRSRDVHFRDAAPAVDAAAISELVRATFTHADGAAEGDLVGDLAQALLRETPPKDQYCAVAELQNRLVGAVIWTRMTYQAGRVQDVFLMSPVAVAPAAQRQGIGQRLIAYGLDHLRDARLGIVLTYGDPQYYARCGFQRLDPADVTPPYNLSQPTGWLGLSLQDQEMPPLPGPVTCAAALADPSYW